MRRLALALLLTASPAAAQPAMTLARQPALVTCGGCDAFALVNVGGRLLTPFGDASLPGTSGKLSMGLAELVAGHARYVPTGDILAGGLDAKGGGAAGMKPSSALAVGGRMYVWVRNLTVKGGARLKFSDTPDVPGSWVWADWTQPGWGYPTFVQGLTDGSAAVLVADTANAYHAGSTLTLYRMAAADILAREVWSAPTIVFRDPGKTLRVRADCYPVRQRCYLAEVPGSRRHHSGGASSGLVVWSAPGLDGPWTQLLRTTRPLGESVDLSPVWAADVPVTQPLVGRAVTAAGDRLAGYAYTVGAGW